MDGYQTTRIENFSLRSFNQFKLNARLKEIAKELNSLPETPTSMDNWINSWAPLTHKGFGIDTFFKQRKIKKEYDLLIESADTNLREMKILAIEDLIDKINKTLNPSD